MAKWVKIYLDWEDALEPFSDEEVGRILKAILQYVRDGVEPEFEGNEKFIWPMIKNTLDRDSKAREEISKSRAESGKNGGLAKASKSGKCHSLPEDVANASKDSKCYQKVANVANASKTSKCQVLPESLARDKEIKRERNKDIKRERDKENRSEKMNEAIDTWLQYKKERGQTYKPTGESALLKKIDSMTAEYGEQAVIDVINLSIANNWQGIIWDRIESGNTQGKSNNKKPLATKKENEERLKKDLDWLEKFTEESGGL